MTELRFLKWEGLGNDFIFVQGEPPAQAADWAPQVCDRHFGIGADGLAFISDEPRMVLFNSDGSRGSMCGNAVRCIGAWFHQRGRLPLEEWLTVQTDSGPRRLRVVRPNWVEVDMGAPAAVQGLPELEALKLVGLPGHFINMGNDHLAILCPEGLPPQDRFLEWGAALQSYPGLPGQGINVEFVARAQDGLQVIVWERGVGPTLACGTGACAAAVAAIRVGWVNGTVPVYLPGGKLEISWKGDSQPVMMAGPARQVFTGVMNGYPATPSAAD